MRCYQSLTPFRSIHVLCKVEEIGAEPSSGENIAKLALRAFARRHLVSRARAPRHAVSLLSPCYASDWAAQAVSLPWCMLSHHDVACSVVPHAALGGRAGRRSGRRLRAAAALCRCMII